MLVSNWSVFESTQGINLIVFSSCGDNKTHRQPAPAADARHLPPAADTGGPLAFHYQVYALRWTCAGTYVITVHSEIKLERK